MRIRDSGMAEEAVWESFFEPASILSKLGLCATCGDLAESDSRLVKTYDTAWAMAN